MHINILTIMSNNFIVIFSNADNDASRSLAGTRSSGNVMRVTILYVGTTQENRIIYYKRKQYYFIQNKMLRLKYRYTVK